MEGSHSDFSLFLFLDRPIVFELSLLIVAVAAVVHAVTLHRRVASLIRKQVLIGERQLYSPFHQFHRHDILTRTAQIYCR